MLQHLSKKDPPRAPKESIRSIGIPHVPHVGTNFSIYEITPGIVGLVHIKALRILDAASYHSLAFSSLFSASLEASWSLLRLTSPTSTATVCKRSLIQASASFSTKATTNPYRFPRSFIKISRPNSLLHLPSGGRWPHILLLQMPQRRPAPLPAVVPLKLLLLLLQVPGSTKRISRTTLRSLYSPSSLFCLFVASPGSLLDFLAGQNGPKATSFATSLL